MCFRAAVFDRFLIGSCLGVCIFATACGTPASAIAAALPTCIFPTPAANPYRSHQLSENAARIYADYRNGSLSARQDAFTQLGKNTGHWSDYKDMPINDEQMVRVVVTYLDPVLVQYVVLNHLLSRINTTSLIDINNSTPQNDFAAKVDETMRNLSGRNEMLFVITVTTPFYRAQAHNENILTVQIPIKEMELISGADIRVRPTHDDHILAQTIVITHGPMSGIVGYPIAVTNNDQCIQVIDDWTTSLTLVVPSIKVGDTVLGPQFWSIPYRSLVMQDDYHPVPTFDPYYDSTRISKITSPPTPNWIPNAQFDNTDWRMYWEDMGRHIWNLVITESDH